MRTSTYSLITLAAVMAVLSGGCKKVDPRTQVMLVVDADDDYRLLITDVTIEVFSKAEEPSAAATAGVGAPAADGGTMPLASDAPATSLFTTMLKPMDLDAGTWPFEFALIPRTGDMSRTYRVVATAMKDGEVIGVLRAESGFVPKKTIALQLRFETACLRKLCMETETCEAGACVSSVKNPADLPAYSGNDRDVTPPGSAGAAGDITIPIGSGGSGGNGTIKNPSIGTGGTSGGGISTGGGSGGSSGGGGGGGIDDPDAPLVDAVCGDGKITGNETCDTAIAEGQSGACPTECRAASACETSRLAGTGCRTRCMPTTITMPESGDMCCPMGADGNTDADCSASCGNGSIEMGETCDPQDSCPNANTCKVEGNNKCLKARVLGDASQCNATCAIEPIDVCMNGDGCCPSGCSRMNDNDCSASCGDRVIDTQAGELCEDGTSTPCPTECEDDEACTFELFTGSAKNCNSVCTIIPIFLSIPRDGCCPFGANANSDSDCEPFCGNRVVERGERCDGNCPNANACNDNNSCTRDGITGNGCNVQCTHQQITNASQNSDGCCPPGGNGNNDADCEPVCGNGVREDGELCDGNNCPTSCNDGNPCTRDMLVGEGCQRRCTTEGIGPSGTTTDGCCPNGQTFETDADCAGCGNGRKDPGETCDPSAGAAGQCPGCTAAMCMSAVPGGTTCNPTCNRQPINAPANGDGCCPSTANANNDDDCRPMCGNRVVEGDEDCDSAPGQVCAECQRMDGCTRGAVANCKCTTTTINTPSGNTSDSCCPGSAGPTNDVDCDGCGNRRVESGEDCDPPNGTTCSPTCQTIVPDPPEPPDPPPAQ